MPHATGIVLAGGHSRRMGRDKATLPFGPDTLLGWVVRRVRSVCPRVLVVAREPARYPGFEVVPDRFPGLGPLAGLHAGLSVAETELGVCVACDLPFVEPALLRHLLHAAEEVDAVVPVVRGKPEPLCAVYRRTALLPAEALLRAGGGSLRDLFARLRVRFVPEPELRQADPELLSFLNLNTPEDYARALRRLRGED
ncbi:MAG: molybdenum cofactor guanylyltransferase [Armatimonadetes bacterium]|nr:molybdenum cofactor guanylyltransferase [Armatimonadota bacterium]MDW8154653.1 molybdenum cofactor guanylyltransferase [Armatimonadota bacterium]